MISDESFQNFVERHKKQKCLVVESNNVMRTSYLMLDENMCFLDCSSGGKIASPSILDVGVEEAYKHAGFNHELFALRGALYDWTKKKTDCSSINDW